MAGDCSTARFPCHDKTWAEKAAHLAACAAAMACTVHATMALRTIWLHRDAPPKPAVGQPCNGCGVCCAAEPCPLGMLLSLRTRGRCRMLRFDPAQSLYRCGLVPTPTRAHAMGWTARWAQRLV